MTNQTSLVLLPRWARRAGVLAAATLVLSLSCGAGAHADGGLLDDVTEVAGGATQQGQPVVEAVQSAVAQPVPEVVQPVVEQVVEPTVSQVEQALGAVPGADDGAEPVVEEVKEVGRGPQAPAEAPAAGDGGPVQSGQAPAAPQAPAASEAPVPVPSGPLGGGSSDGPRHQEEHGSASTGSPRGDDAPVLLADACDLPPRTLTAPAMVHQLGGSDGPRADQTVWGLAYALMQMWAQGALSPSFARDWPEDRASEARTPGLTEARSPAAPMPATDATGAVGMLGMLGVLGVVLLLLAAGLTIVLTQQDESPALRWRP